MEVQIQFRIHSSRGGFWPGRCGFRGCPCRGFVRASIMKTVHQLSSQGYKAAAGNRREDKRQISFS